MSETINISGIDKAELLAALHNGTHCQGMGVLHDIGTMTREQAASMISECNGILRFDYVCGRPLKCNITGDSLNPWAYDRDAGQGRAKQIVDGLRAAKQ